MDQILKTLTEKYGHIHRLTGGFTNATYLLDTSPQLVAKVATLSNQDLLNEMNVLQFMGGREIAPQFIETFSIGPSLILITSFKQGVNGQSILDTEDMERAKMLFHRMGTCLAKDIHSIPYVGENTTLRKAKPVPTPFELVPHDLLTDSEAYLNDINMDQSTWVLTHGDYGSHNILFGEKDQFAVIDWEWSEWFHPMVDIAWTCWNTKLHYPKVADLLNQTFINAYQSVKPLHFTEDQLKTYVLYKLWTILNKVQNADKITQEKWVKRLEWTLKTKIMGSSQTCC